jgi:hypothetical protein
VGNDVANNLSVDGLDEQSVRRDAELTTVSAHPARQFDPAPGANRGGYEMRRARRESEADGRILRLDRFDIIACSRAVEWAGRAGASGSSAGR